ncbi:MAG: uracil phosphoribosyltransferase [Sphaerochaetaceae bacterium]|nr:uracil phosphoribosyltransferase [Sphaerochaetaceae bacterium]NLO61038.1 uracil phosphoribosyltransferase [Spirochaetales bacterium]MDD2407089.1 uracil phosphoribosyltransferase [Sphaerochaetaceae bacterium]MDD3671754.1 uracil phosphoribosyltransferase [Sphaerochaetaceae bacterium]MDD4260081.1 uracil phosphoribosyltransferase [Sphaerochaetaceae bacterium]
MNKIVLHASDLDGFLTTEDKKKIAHAHSLYEEAMALFAKIERGGSIAEDAVCSLTPVFERIGRYLKEVVASEDGIHVYSFETPQVQHGAASRLIAKLRDPKTQHEEFLYYVQRAYELLFAHVYSDRALPKKRSIVTKTPVTLPLQNYAIHKIPDVDNLIENTVMCVMLRGALLPSMIISKEIEEHSSDGYVTPFALFKIKRDDTKVEYNMDYLLDLDRSFFNLEGLDGKDLIFADPMNATGGSLVTIVKYIMSQGIKPKSIKFINVISALKGALRVVRAIEGAEVYTLWMDPVLNEKAYILPGLGDAGDRLNGEDLPDNPRNMIQLMADYGTNITNLYRAQVKEIEMTVLGRNGMWGE